jgi:hypothetical protein
MEPHFSLYFIILFGGFNHPISGALPDFARVSKKLFIIPKIIAAGFYATEIPNPNFRI